MIQEDNSYIQTVMKLGPTFLQAKIYLNLAKLGKADAKTIAKVSSMARSEVYRIMPALEKLGLVEKIIAKTTMYKATPIKEGISVLLQNKKKEYAEIELKSSSLINNFNTNNLQDFQEENQQFKITSEMTLLLKMLDNLVRSAKTSTDIILPGEGFQEALFRGFLKKAKKSVKIRVIIQKVGEKTLLVKTQALAKNPSIEIKYSNNPDPFGMHIFDKKMVTLCVSEPGGLPSLWSNNHNVVKLAEAYFENIWSSTEIN